MTIAQVKQQLGIIALDLQRGTDEAGKPTEWLRYWDNTRRFAVVLHQDIVAAIKADVNLATLALKHTTEVTKTGELAGTTYENYILINATKSIEVSL